MKAVYSQQEAPSGASASKIPQVIFRQGQVFMSENRRPVEHSSADSGSVMTAVPPAPGTDAEKAALMKRVRALETVIATERKLRRLQDDVAAELRQRLEVAVTPAAPAPSAPSAAD